MYDSKAVFGFVLSRLPAAGRVFLFEDIISRKIFGIQGIALFLIPDIFCGARCPSAQKIPGWRNVPCLHYFYELLLLNKSYKIKTKTAQSKLFLFVIFKGIYYW